GGAAGEAIRVERGCFLLTVRPDRLGEYARRPPGGLPRLLGAPPLPGGGDYSPFLRPGGVPVGCPGTGRFSPAPRGGAGARGDARRAGGQGRVLRAAGRGAARHLIGAPDRDLPPRVTLRRPGPRGRPAGGRGRTRTAGPGRSRGRQRPPRPAAGRDQGGPQLP